MYTTQPRSRSGRADANPVSWVPASGCAPANRSPSPGRHRLLHHRSLDAAHIGQECARLERGASWSIRSSVGTRRHREHHQVRATHRAGGGVGQIGDGRGLQRLDPLGRSGE